MLKQMTEVMLEEVSYKKQNLVSCKDTIMLLTLCEITVFKDILILAMLDCLSITNYCI